jgi:hypothetical protein
VRGSRGADQSERINAIERAIAEAGFDGYLSLDPLSRQGAAGRQAQGSAA